MDYSAGYIQGLRLVMVSHKRASACARCAAGSLVLTGKLRLICINIFPTRISNIDRIFDYQHLEYYINQIIIILNFYSFLFI